MRAWGRQSRAVYAELDERLQRVFDRVLTEVADVSLIEGFRNELKQNAAFDSGMSKVRWPDGRHNQRPSKAVDFQPYPRPAEDVMLRTALAYIAGRAIQIGIEEGVTLRWGGDWDRDGELTDQDFQDLFHLEIVDEKDNDTCSVAVQSNASELQGSRSD